MVKRESLDARPERVPALHPAAARRRGAPRLPDSMSSDNKRSRGRNVNLQSDLVGMMYGFGDAEKPNVESVALVEKLVVQYVQNLCADATAVSRLRDQKLDTGCFLLSIRSQTPKYLRCQDLLEMRARLKEVRKIGPGQDD